MTDVGAAAGPVPIGFPGCRLCPYRRAGRPEVCLPCLERSAGQGPHQARARRCSVCGQPRVVPGGPAGTCPTPACARPARPWSVAFDVGVYAGGLRRAVLGYKFGAQRWWAGVFATLVAGWLDRHAGWLEDFDLIVAVPSHTGPGGRRGWDPVGDVAAALAGLVGPGWEVGAGVVTKRAETPPMGGAPSWQRQRGLQAAWRRALVVPRPAAVAGRRVVLLDDVLTVGATASAVAGALRDAGAAEVAVLALARARWDAVPPGPRRRGGTRGRPG